MWVEEASTVDIDHITRFFTNQQYDKESGLYYYNARYYDPHLGSFITPDSAMDGINHYAYANSNPIKYSDPTGLAADEAAQAGESGGAGAQGAAAGLGLGGDGGSDDSSDNNNPQGSEGAQLVKPKGEEEEEKEKDERTPVEKWNDFVDKWLGGGGGPDGAGPRGGGTSYYYNDLVDFCRRGKDAPRVRGIDFNFGLASRLSQMAKGYGNKPQGKSDVGKNAGKSSTVPVGATRNKNTEKHSKNINKNTLNKIMDLISSKYDLTSKGLQAVSDKLSQLTAKQLENVYSQMQNFIKNFDGGYIDINISGGYWAGATGGLMFSLSGVYAYIGDGAVTPGISGAITFSPS